MNQPGAFIPTGSATPTAREGSVGYLALVCLVASLAGLLFGFDTAVISGTIDRVKAQFGLTDLLEGWFTSSALVGCIFGTLAAGALGNCSGRKPVLLASAALFLLSGIGSAIPPDFGILVFARLVCGIAVGAASVVAPMYISEFAPPKWRGRLVACYQLSIVIGILLAYLSNWAILRFALAHGADAGSTHFFDWIFVREYWRGMFGAEAIPAALFLVLLFFVPESPRWLIKAGRDAAGLSVLAAVSGLQVAQKEFEAIRQGLNRRESSLAELFRPGLRTALLVGVMLSVFGQLSGVNIVVYYGPKILGAAGYHDAGALLGQVGFGLINLIFTVLALIVIDSLGRRPLLIGGMAIVTLALAVIGGLFLFGIPSASSLAHGAEMAVSKGVGLWIGAMICLYVACIALSICAVIWVLTAEIFPNRLRSRAVSIATFANWFTNAFSALAFPWYVARFGMHTFFFTTAGICFVATLFFWRYVPETKGRSLEEIERLWIRR